MSVDDSASHSMLRRELARRVAHAHAPLAPADTLCAMVFGSSAEALSDERSDVDMSLVFDTLPDEAALRAACRAAGGGEWTWFNGEPRTEGLAVGFPVDGIEVQIAYTEPRILQADLDKLLGATEPDTPNHKIAEGLLKAQPLIAPEKLAAWRAQVATFPPALGDAMMRHYVNQPTPWRWFTLLMHRDGALWSRQLIVEACFRQFGMLAGLNRSYFTTFQFKRMHRFADQLALAPPQLADRVQALLEAPLAPAFDALFALEGQVLDLLATHAPQIDLAAARDRRTRYGARR